MEIKSKLMRCCCFNTHRHCFIRSLSSINKTKTKQEHLNQIRQRKQYQFKDILISFYKLIPPPPPKQQIPVVCSPIPIPKRFSVFFLRINTATIQSKKKKKKKKKKQQVSSCLFSHTHTKSLVFFFFSFFLCINTTNKQTKQNKTKSSTFTLFVFPFP